MKCRKLLKSVKHSVLTRKSWLLLLESIVFFVLKPVELSGNARIFGEWVIGRGVSLNATTTFLGEGLEMVSPY